MVKFPKGLTDQIRWGEGMTYEYHSLNVTDIAFDTENPRIKKALEKYGDRITAERIHFALQSASDDSNAGSTFTRLRDSIRANGGITQPITVVSEGEEFRCIDGNTRLSIYQDFLKNHADGPWMTIRALVINDPSQKDIETIRVSAHLIGPRPWPAYEKARYFDYLYNQEFLERAQIVALCGGNEPEIARQIQAYQDMNEYYRDRVRDDAFHIDRFSGFVELQTANVRNSIFEAGFELADFGNWIRDSKITRLADVRQLPRVLADEDAKAMFVSGGPRSIENAMKYLEQKRSAKQVGNSVMLEEATPETLARTLVQKIDQMPYSDVSTIKAGDTDDAKGIVDALEYLAERLEEFLGDVRD